MGGLSGRLDRLRRAFAGETFDVRCPTCGERFRGTGDVAMSITVADWLDGAGLEREPNPIVDAIRDHPHEALRREILGDIPAFRHAQ